jgi:hypothetical protein
MAIRVSSRKMSTVWSLNGRVSEKSWPHPTALGRRGGRGGDDCRRGAARRDELQWTVRSMGGGQLAWLGATVNWGRTDCAGLHQGFQALQRCPVRRRPEGYRRPSRSIGQPMQVSRPAEEGALGKQNARLQSQRHHHSCWPPSTCLTSCWPAQERHQGSRYRRP